ncbi:hypothetical protein BKA82DRAFT_302082 [Pisolithus tinctorius]|uniref:Uncharacterized protein n=1 Tax=Pisolithus tinctorius Marx 270 TaxID=870435 RepID=A0A0C3JIN0_PISTI|nr:hypothetical protein BKA82DRAFT_302082 [Pisolithus tinctorius]KIO08958.1 hypothetical protein M404DRAFT_302082 [Pisolithus tinctorius Marx 270]
MLLCIPRYWVVRYTFPIQFRTATVEIYLLLYSEGGEATSGIVLDWVAKMAWFLFLVYVCGFSIICYSLVLVPLSCCHSRVSPLPPPCDTSPIMVPLDETLRMVYSLCALFLLLSFLTYNYCIFAS